MLFFVFSFNRGRFLENCIASIEQCAPGSRIIVVDDNSYDPPTVEALDAIAKRHRVIRRKDMNARRLGGLYGNMSAAYELSQDEDLVCYLQDDTQMVRRLDSNDLELLRRLLRADSDIGFVHPCFLRGRNRARDAGSMRFDSERGCYFREEGKQSAGRHFSALLITSPSKLRASEWSFGDSEPENDRKASQAFGSMAYLHAPFAMWLPEVPVYRGKEKTWVLQYCERRRGCGFYPFRILSDEEAASLKSRPSDVLPIAEDFLVCENADIPGPWAYHPMQGSRWLQRLNSVEVACRRAFKRH